MYNKHWFNPNGYYWWARQGWHKGKVVRPNQALNWRHPWWYMKSRVGTLHRHWCFEHWVHLQDLFRAAHILWRSLPQTISLASNIHTFKHALKNNYSSRRPMSHNPSSWTVHNLTWWPISPLYPLFSIHYPLMSDTFLSIAMWSYSTLLTLFCLCTEYSNNTMVKLVETCHSGMGASGAHAHIWAV